jgi:HD superfamily phosphohydrolase
MEENNEIKLMEKSDKLDEILNYDSIDSYDETDMLDKKNNLLCKVKSIYIPIHKSVNITLFGKYMIDTNYFQRLRNLKQLGTCEYIYPSATHTRFEHSIGTYYLSSKLLETIILKTNFNNIRRYLEKIPELESYFNKPKVKLRKTIYWIFEMVNISALCHDIGHGPFSHLFDDIFIKESEYHSHDNATHETRSCLILELIIKENKELSEIITKNDIQFMKNIIDPKEEHKGFIYQIVSNTLNGLDVDKYDYIIRDAHHLDIKTNFDCTSLINDILVIDNNIIYSEQSTNYIYNLFSTRHNLHKIAYSHKGVISSEYLIMKIIKIVNKVINIGKSITDMKKFLKMTDNYIMEYGIFILENKEVFAHHLDKIDYDLLEYYLDRLNKHELLPIIGITNSIDKIEIPEYFKSEYYMVFHKKMGFVSGNKSNPLDDIYIYKTKDLYNKNMNIKKHIKSYKLCKYDISRMITDTYQEYVSMFFRIDRDQEELKKDKRMFKKIFDK